MRALIAVAVAALVPAAAWAQTCGVPDLLSTVPRDGAAAVPVDAPLHAFYAAATLYQNEPVVVDLPDGNTWALVGTFDQAEGRLTVTPPEPLVPLGRYTVRWPELRGTTSGGKGLGAIIAFTAGTDVDREAPSFGGATRLEWDWVRDTDDCTDKIEDRLDFDVWLGEASDDGGRESLTLILSQTRGPLLTTGPRQVLLGALPAAGEPAHLGLGVDSAVGRICFAALARDLTGKISTGGEREVCAEVTRPPFFNGCALAPGSSRATGLWLVALASLIALWRRGHAR